MADLRKEEENISQLDAQNKYLVLKQKMKEMEDMRKKQVEKLYSDKCKDINNTNIQKISPFSIIKELSDNIKMIESAKINICKKKSLNSNLEGNFVPLNVIINQSQVVNSNLEPVAKIRENRLQCSDTQWDNDSQMVAVMDSADAISNIFDTTMTQNEEYMDIDATCDFGKIITQNVFIDPCRNATESDKIQKKTNEDLNLNSECFHGNLNLVQKPNSNVEQDVIFKVPNPVKKSKNLSTVEKNAENFVCSLKNMNTDVQLPNAPYKSVDAQKNLFLTSVIESELDRYQNKRNDIFPAGDNPIFHLEKCSNIGDDFNCGDIDEENGETKNVDKNDACDRSVENIFNVGNNCEAHQRVLPTEGSSGFKTASNKNIPISKIAIEKTKNVFQDFYAECGNSANLQDEALLPDAENSDFVGFKTASDKNIPISKVSVEKAKNVFKDLDLDCGNTVNLKDKVLLPDAKNSDFIGFKTASNKNIPVSKDAIEKSKNVFKDVDLDCGNNLNLNKEEVLPCINAALNKLGSGDYFGFEIANNNKIIDNLKSDVKNDELIFDNSLLEKSNLDLNTEYNVETIVHSEIKLYQDSPVFQNEEDEETDELCVKEEVDEWFIKEEAGELTIKEEVVCLFDGASLELNSGDLEILFNDEMKDQEERDSKRLIRLEVDLNSRENLIKVEPSSTQVITSLTEHNMSLSELDRKTMELDVHSVEMKNLMCTKVDSIELIPNSIGLEENLIKFDTESMKSDNNLNELKNSINFDFNSTKLSKKSMGFDRVPSPLNKEVFECEKPIVVSKAAMLKVQEMFDKIDVSFEVKRLTPKKSFHIKKECITDEGVVKKRIEDSSTFLFDSDEEFIPSSPIIKSRTRRRSFKNVRLRRSDDFKGKECEKVTLIKNEEMVDDSKRMSDENVICINDTDTRQYSPIIKPQGKKINDSNNEEIKTIDDSKKENDEEVLMIEDDNRKHYSPIEKSPVKKKNHVKKEEMKVLDDAKNKNEDTIILADDWNKKTTPFSPIIKSQTKKKIKDLKTNEKLDFEMEKDDKIILVDDFCDGPSSPIIRSQMKKKKIVCVEAKDFDDFERKMNDPMFLEDNEGDNEIKSFSPTIQAQTERKASTLATDEDKMLDVNVKQKEIGLSSPIVESQSKKKKKLSDSTQSSIKSMLENIDDFTCSFHVRETMPVIELKKKITDVCDSNDEKNHLSPIIGSQKCKKGWRKIKQNERKIGGMGDRELKTKESEMLTEETKEINLKNSRIAEEPKKMVILLKEDDEKVMTDDFKRKKLLKESNSFHSGFETASFKPITVSKNALDKAKNVFNGCEYESNVDEILEGIDTENGSTKMNEKNKDLLNEFEQNCNKDWKNDKLLKTKDTRVFSNFEAENITHVTISQEEPIRFESDFKDFQENVSDVNKPLVGFMTASSKKITVSASAMAKIKNIFREEDFGLKVEEKVKHVNIEHHENVCSKIFDQDGEDRFDGTKTVIESKGKNLKDLKKVEERSGIDEEYATIKSHDAKCDNLEIIKSVRAPKFTGFMTASSKKVIVSEAAMRAAKNIFRDVETDVDLPKIETCFEKVEVSEAMSKFQDLDDIECAGVEKNSEQFVGFKTANEKKIEVSKAALAKTRDIFSKLEESKSMNMKNDSMPKFSGFMTANRKKVAISERALAKTKDIFNDLDPDSYTVDENNDSMPKFTGFMTANRKKVAISESALAKTKDIFNDLDNDKNSIDAKNESIPKFTGFMTANRKKVAISESALAKTKDIFNDLDNDKNSIDAKNESIPKFTGFMTANRKKVAISESALAKTKNIFNYLDNDKDSIDAKNESIPKFTGFMTANRKKVAISESALAKTKDIFNDLDPDSHTVDENDDSMPKFTGFMTANRKKVAISESALAKAKNVFQNIDLNVQSQDMHSFENNKIDNVENIFCNIKTRKFDGFSTASNKKIKVSDDALIRAKNLFEEYDKNDLSFHGETAKPTIPSLGALAMKKLQKLKDDKIIVDIFTSKDASFTDSMKMKGILTDSLTNSEKYELKTMGNDLMGDDLMEKIEIKSTLNEILPDYCGDNIIDEISESAFAFLADEKSKQDALVYNSPTSKKVLDSRSSSPILQCKPMKKRKVFKVPLKKDTSIVADSDALNPCKKIKITERENASDAEISVDFDLGTLIEEKNNKKVTLKDLYTMKAKSKITTNIPDDVMNITPENFSEFIFKGKRIDLEVDKLEISINELVNMFEKHKAVDIKLIPEGWTLNHCKWIVWKLASYERRFLGLCDGVLSVLNVLKQLKYRYDRELFKTERPVLRKILEKDDPPGKRMVLCVARINKIEAKEKSESACNTSDPQYEVELTDGWYGVQSLLDSLLCSAVTSGKITVGTKLMVYGAELINCVQGKSPLEDLGATRLQIHGNSTRRASWDLKLGLYRHPWPPLLSLGSGRARGGPLPRLRLMVLKVYPTLYTERLPSGDTITRPERCEQLHIASLDTARRLKCDQLYSQAEKEISERVERSRKNVRRSARRGTVTHCQDGDELVEAMESALDPTDFMNSLSASQRDTISRTMLERNSRIQQEIEQRVWQLMSEAGHTSDRKVVRVQKVRVAALEAAGVTTVALLTVWGTQQSFEEGMLMDAMQVSPTGIRSGEVHISAGKRTVFTEVTNRKSLEDYPEVDSMKRQFTPIQDTNQTDFKPVFNEVDTVGLVFHLEPSGTLNSPGNTSRNLNQHSNVQTAYMADEFMNILAVNFWGGIESIGYQKIVEVGKFLACCNLQHRPKIPKKRMRYLYATELTLFTQSPKNITLRNNLKLLEDRIKLQGVKEYTSECCKILLNYSNNTLVDSFKMASFQNESNSSLMSKTEINQMCRRSSLSKIAIRNVFKDELSLTGIDFDSTFTETSRNESCCSYSSSTEIEERIKKLRKYGEPPPLAPAILNVSQNLKKEFVVPKLNVATEHSIDNNKSMTSDSEKGDNIINEDFQYSPPLSLE